MPAADDLDDATAERVSLSVGIDAAWLLAGESGAQVFAFEMLKEMASRDDIERIVLLSETGQVPAPLARVAGITGGTWPQMRDRAVPMCDVLHRPYQPAADMNLGRYRQAGRVVVLTVLDFIAYDRADYHESRREWRRHRAYFDEQVELVDGVFAISQHVAARVDTQYGKRLRVPVRATVLGTDHLAPGPDLMAVTTAGPSLPASLPAAVEGEFLLVLGNDFAHKNRDFAVRVFARMCERGYRGHLVLAGFHLDRGSSYAYELDGAGAFGSRVLRIGRVSPSERIWLLRRAGAVLYPTSAEGFGFVPFEAAALGTPAAFVRFGPLRETMPAVDACVEWEVQAFAELVERLLENPGPQVRAIRRAALALTWAAHVDEVLRGYHQILAASRTSSWRRPRLPGPHVRACRTAERLARQAASRTARLIRRG
jgi:glycosyltransferase involved in cell wall biosynthesis